MFGGSPRNFMVLEIKVENSIQLFWKLNGYNNLKTNAF